MCQPCAQPRAVCSLSLAKQGALPPFIAASPPPSHVMLRGCGVGCACSARSFWRVLLLQARLCVPVRCICMMPGWWLGWACDQMSCRATSMRLLGEIACSCVCASFATRWGSFRFPPGRCACAYSFAASVAQPVPLTVWVFAGNASSSFTIVRSSDDW